VIEEHFNAFPEELRKELLWVNYRKVPRDGRVSKLPLQPDGSPAESNNPQTWSSFESVVAALPKFDGIGCMIVEPWIGIDFDHVCRDFRATTIESWCLAAITRLNSYTEFSPSGEGIHVWCRGKLPPGRRRCGRVEIYQGGRFFTVTGRCL
jgi:putative DNA primase/helicase